MSSARERHFSLRRQRYLGVPRLPQLPYRDTVVRLSDAIERRGLTVFGRIDHAAAARELDLELEDEEVVVSLDAGALAGGRVRARADLGR